MKGSLSWLQQILGFVVEAVFGRWSMSGLATQQIIRFIAKAVSSTN